MYFTTKALVIALAAGAVAMAADTPHGGAPGALSKPKHGGNSTKLTPPPPGAKKGADKRDFLGIPFPNITGIFKGIGARDEEGAKLPGPPHHGGKNATKLPPPGVRRVRRSLARSKEDCGELPGGKNMTMPEATKTKRQEEEDDEDKAPKGDGGESEEGEEGGVGTGSDDKEADDGNGSGAPEAEDEEDDKPKKLEGSGAPKPPKGSDAPVTAAGSAPPPAPKSNGTMPHPPGHKGAGKRKARSPVALPIRFWA
ncbi:uncharacterized protein PG986_009961 [Apiospora aurea]|uniref:Uncharacterized protein n=1 Tax=Apiospora aurea TaxID=335848 RepID=A0ABR1Q9F3_9PEZI